MSNNFLSNVYGVLFHPVATFETLVKEEHPPLLQGLGIVLLVATIGCMGAFHGESVVGLGVSLVYYIVFALISWVFFAAILDFLIASFLKQHKFELILAITAFSVLPWLLVTPVALFKYGGTIGAVISILLSLFVWIWTAVLFIISLTKVLEFSVARTFLLLLMPFLGTIISLSWAVGFLSNLINILNIP